MPSWKITGAAVTLCVLSGLAEAALAVEPDLRVRLDLGYDSNPLRLSEGGEGGIFAQIGLDGGLEHKLATRVKLFADADLRQRLHASGLDAADDLDGALRAGLTLSPIRVGRDRLSFSFGGAYRISRGTYTDRVTGDPLAVPASPATDPPTFVAVPDRFDSTSTGAFFDARWRTSRRLLLFLRSQLNDVRYAEDYGDSTALEPIDYRAFILEPGIVMRVAEPAAVRASIVLANLDYERQTALDDQGRSVPGTRREYHHADVRVTFYVDPTDGLKMRLGLSAGERADTYAGYYDYRSLTRFATLERAFGENRLHFSGSVRSLDYDRAVIPGDPERDLLGSDVRRLTGRYERRFGKRLGWFSEAGRQRVDSSDPVYAYDRDWLMTGFEYKQ